MNVGELAAQAIGAVAAHLGAIASGVVGRVEGFATDQLFRLVADRLRSTELGAAALRGLEEQPYSVTRQQMATAALTEAATADEEYAVWLHNAVVSQGQANIHAGGNMTLTRGEIAGSIDKSRRGVRLGLGGLVLAGVLLLGGVTAGVVIWNDDPPADPTTIGLGRDKAGVREALKGFLDAIAARDSARVCAFIASEDVEAMMRRGGCVTVLQAVLFNRVPEDVTSRMADVHVASGRLLLSPTDSFGIAEVEMSEDVVGLDRSSVELSFENGRWMVEWYR